MLADKFVTNKINTFIGGIHGLFPHFVAKHTGFGNYTILGSDFELLC